MTSRALLWRVGGLARDQRGVSLIEFAFMAPVLALMIVGIADVAMGAASKLRLEQAAHRALEKVAVGTVQTDYSFVAAEAATAAGVDPAEVTVDSWLECDRVRQPDFQGSCAAGEMISRYVEVRIESGYEPHFSFGPVARALGERADGTVPITATAALRIQ